MIKLLSVIGARPQIIKAAALSRAIKNHYQSRIREMIVHTGQHYDENMSAVFFEEMGIPLPDYNLHVGSGLHGEQTAMMIKGIEEILLKEKPDMLLVYGDTNSTLAAAIAASKIHVPIAHVEAGLRSFNKQMPEEINRILCDHTSTLLFTPTLSGFSNLLKEGFKENAAPPYTADNPKVFHCGDVMYDNSLFFSTLAAKKSSILPLLNLQNKPYILVTIHRDANTDMPDRIASIFNALQNIVNTTQYHLVLPLHPRTKKILGQKGNQGILTQIEAHKQIHIIPPASFLDMISLESNASLIITDSGGVQKESYFFRKPCIILRPQTEWVEIVETGTAILADTDSSRIMSAYEELIHKTNLNFPPIFGDGKAAEFICEKIMETLSR